jgi:hypothetical protein
MSKLHRRLTKCGCACLPQRFALALGLCEPTVCSVFSLSKDRFGFEGPNNIGFRATVVFGVNGMLSASILKADIPIDSTKPDMCRFCCQRFIFMT